VRRHRPGQGRLAHRCAAPRLARGIPSARLLPRLPLGGSSGAAA
jgi:hypothetical protein